MKNLTKTLFVSVFFSIALTGQISAQLSAPTAESVYGGRIIAMTGYSRTPDTSRIFVATESANSIFYADVATSGTPVFGSFTVMPGVDAGANYGANINNLTAHEASGMVFFTHQTGLLSSHPSSTTVNTVHSGNVQNLLIKDSYLLFIEASNLHFGTLDASGLFSNSSGSPLAMPTSMGPPTLFANPVDGVVYVFIEGNSPKLYKLSDTYDALSASTTYTDISPTTLSAAYEWRAFGIAPSGKCLIGSSDAFNKYVAYTDDEITWTSYATGLGGIASSKIAFSGDSASYSVYFSKGYNNNNGNSGSWFEFGNPGGFETHPNDGPVFVDPNNGNIVYMTTDQGLGASTDQGETIFEINDGIEAVQVRGFDMTSDKNVAWLASKSGIRKVTNYQSSPLWTNAMFPTGDGSPYYSAEMQPGDTNTAYVGNVRIYKTTDGGSNWTRIFSPENPPYHFSSFGAKALAIEVCDDDSSIVFAGFEISDTQKGGLFYSTDAGVTWDQILIEASSTGQDVDVSDIVFNLEGSDTVAYVGVQYDLSSPQGRSVYKLIKSGSSWTVTQDFNSSTTSVGYAITATIWDLHVSSTGDTIYAAGTDAGVNHPIAYYKPLNTTGLWTPMPTSGFPFTSGKEATAITLGIDTVYCAVDNEIYFCPLSDSSWQLGYSYPVGFRINFLYYDDLLVGTETGLYGHNGISNTTGVDDEPSLPTEIALHQNYPNPFNPGTLIHYELSQASRVVLKIYSLLGKEVTTLVDTFKPAGNHSTKFDASHLPAGVYFYTIEAGSFRATRKMLFLQ